MPCYVGHYRGDPSCPELLNYGVRVGISYGTPPGLVAGALLQFVDQMRRGVALLDPVIPIGLPPQTTGELRGVINLAANAHGEWVRIHPFAHGNGRTARIWANWIMVRYGLPPFVRLKPRPRGLSYNAASQASMSGDHTPTSLLFMDWVTDRMSP
ncbi:MAG TPA: Fic family protein [Chloroflexota bacterium]|nr:Fic family protein [Chloroflexota bacterium]